MNQEYNEIEQLITRSLTGTLTPQEELRLNELLKNDPQAESLLGHTNKIWNSAGNLTLNEGADRNDRWHSLKGKTIHSRPVRRALLSAQILRYAAVLATLVVIAFLSVFLLRSERIEIHTARGETKRITLPDHSIVQMNAATVISYDPTEWEDERKLNLTGEAYFEVTKSDVPFVVVSKQAKVTVLGTSFNVQAYDKKNIVRCFSGKVSVSKPENDHASILTKGLAVTVDGDQVSAVYRFADNGLPGWLTGTLEFNNTPITQVFKELELKFNKTIEYEGDNSSQKFSGTFDNQEFEGMLKTICLSAGLSYTIKEDSTIVIK